MVQKEPICTSFSTITLPICGNLILFLFTKLKPNPVWPINVPDLITTLSPNNAFSIITFDPITQSFPIFTFDLIITLFPIVVFFPIYEFLSIKQFIPT